LLLFLSLFSFSVVGASAALAPGAQAAGPTVEEVKALFAGWDADTAVANGYQADPFCVDGRLRGQPELGTMGFHYMKGALVDATLNALQPEIVLIGPDRSVVGVEYLVAYAGQAAPSLFGQEFEGPMAGHGPGMPVHYDLHVWFVDNPSGQFADFNPDLPLCPEGTLPPPPTAEMVAGIFSGMPADHAVALGYQPTPFCVDGRVAGKPELGTMGFHYVNEALMAAPVNPMAPPILLVNPHDNTVMGVEYYAPDVGQPTPTIFGQKFEGPMPGHGPGEPTHYDLHMWAIPNPSGMFASFNPAVPLCPAATLPPAPPAAGDTSLPYAIGALALLGIVALGTGLRLARPLR